MKALLKKVASGLVKKVKEHIKPSDIVIIAYRQSKKAIVNEPYWRELTARFIERAAKKHAKKPLTPTEIKASFMRYVLKPLLRYLVRNGRIPQITEEQAERVYSKFERELINIIGKKAQAYKTERKTKQKKAPTKPKKKTKKSSTKKKRRRRRPNYPLTTRLRLGTNTNLFPLTEINQKSNPRPHLH